MKFEDIEPGKVYYHKFYDNDKGRKQKENHVINKYYVFEKDKKTQTVKASANAMPVTTFVKNNYRHWKTTKPE